MKYAQLIFRSVCPVINVYVQCTGYTVCYVNGIAVSTSNMCGEA